MDIDIYKIQTEIKTLQNRKFLIKFAVDGSDYSVYFTDRGFRCKCMHPYSNFLVMKIMKFLFL